LLYLLYRGSYTSIVTVAALAVPCPIVPIFSPIPGQRHDGPQKVR
jgi:hypothetical protein